MKSIGLEKPGMPGRFVSDSSFLKPRYLEKSAWIGHAPFAFWLTSVMRPRVIVELGTHSGFSYFTFCQAVEMLGLKTRCYAIDTWKGDDHSGFYGEETYRLVSQHNEENYSAFSNLVRSSFDDALSDFSNETIDLLHVDGRHFFEDVVHDYESWKPKLSDQSVVLFHDTNVRKRGFGVWRFWRETKRRLPSFEFLHGHGLGILGNDACAPNELRDLLQLREPAQIEDVRRTYCELGGAIADFALADSLSKEEGSRELEFEAQLRAHEARAEVYQRTLQRCEAWMRQTSNEIDAMRKSRSWRITKPLRAISPFRS